MARASIAASEARNSTGQLGFASSIASQYVVGLCSNTSVSAGQCAQTCSHRHYLYLPRGVTPFFTPMYSSPADTSKMTPFLILCSQSDSQTSSCPVCLTKTRDGFLSLSFACAVLNTSDRVEFAARGSAHADAEMSSGPFATAAHRSRLSHAWPRPGFSGNETSGRRFGFLEDWESRSCAGKTDSCSCQRLILCCLSRWRKCQL